LRAVLRRLFASWGLEEVGLAAQGSVAAVGSGLVVEEDSDSAEEAGLGSAADWAKGLEAAAG